MVQELFFTLPVVVPTVQDTVVTTPVVSSTMTTMNEHKEPILQDPIEPIVTQEEEQQPHIEQASTNEAPRRSQRVRRSSFLMTTKFMNMRNFKWRVIPPHLKKP